LLLSLPPLTRQIKDETLAGISVAVAQLPESVAFAIIAQVLRIADDAFTWFRFLHFFFFFFCIFLLLPCLFIFLVPLHFQCLCIPFSLFLICSPRVFLFLTCRGSTHSRPLHRLLHAAALLLLRWAPWHDLWCHCCYGCRTSSPHAGMKGEGVDERVWMRGCG
jgi:hypothetical protein